MNLTRSTSNDQVIISSALKKPILSLKGFWQCWGDNTMKLWTSLTIDDFEEYLLTDSGPNLTSTPPTGNSPPLASTTTPTPAPVDVTALTTTLSAAMLAKPPSSSTDLFMRNKGCGDDVEPLKEPKQWNTWQQSFFLLHMHMILKMSLMLPMFLILLIVMLWPFWGYNKSMHLGSSW